MSLDETADPHANAAAPYSCWTRTPTTAPVTSPYFPDTGVARMRPHETLPEQGASDLGARFTALGG
ncbi:hypothetical protein ABZ567_03890 [Streptomyces sp. NPDC016459]|uniref:hypothetical protein n=1 Tax=Streptomyces sp. NPDC016459 TaxID=3157190 RepID=UPI0033CB32F2